MSTLFSALYIVILLLPFLSLPVPAHCQATTIHAEFDRFPCDQCGRFDCPRCRHVRLRCVRSGLSLRVSACECEKSCVGALCWSAWQTRRGDATLLRTTVPPLRCAPAWPSRCSRLQLRRVACHVCGTLRSAATCVRQHLCVSRGLLTRRRRPISATATPRTRTTSRTHTHAQHDSRRTSLHAQQISSHAAARIKRSSCHSRFSSRSHSDAHAGARQAVAAVSAAARRNKLNQQRGRGRSEHSVRS